MREYPEAIRVLWQRPEGTWVTTWTDGSDERAGTTHGAAWLTGREQIKRRIGLAMGSGFLVVTEDNGRLRQVDPVVTWFGSTFSEMKRDRCSE